MTVVAISPETDKKLSRLTELLNKKRREVVHDALIYMIRKKTEGGVNDGSSSIGESGNRNEHREDG